MGASEQVAGEAMPPSKLLTGRASSGRLTRQTRPPAAGPMERYFRCLSSLGTGTSCAAAGSMAEKQPSITKDATAATLERCRGYASVVSASGHPFFRLSFRIGCVVVTKAPLSGM